MQHRRIIGMLVLALGAAFLLATCGGGGGGSSAPPPPTVVTGSANGITNVGATLNGTVNPNGLDTQAWFEWGTSSTLATYDNTTTQSFTAGTTVQSVSAALSGLTFGTTYYFRMAASSAPGVVSRGAIMNFSTSAARPTVTTAAADNLASTTATLHGQVNPNFLATNAWFEYGTDNVLTSFTATPNAAIGSGSAVVATSANITGLAPGGTVYFRAAASNAVGEQKGNILSFSTANPPPVANAGQDNTVQMGQLVTLDGSGSTTPVGTIIAYLWTQLNGTPVTLSDNTAVKPTFTAPTVPVAGSVLRFQLQVTNSALQTATDNVDITVKWVGYADNFSTNTVGNYIVEQTQSVMTGSFTYDAAGQRALITNDNDVGLKVSPDPAKVTVLPTNAGVFTMTFSPTAAFGTHGGVWVRVMQDANNYYQISNFDYSPSGNPPTAPDLAEVIKVVGGTVTDNVYLPVTGYTEGSTYNLSITFGPTQVVLSGFGSTVTLNTTNNTALTVSTFEIETGQQSAYIDNLKLVGP
jgi:hypothetical protein